MLNSENIYSYLVILIAIFGTIAVARVIFSLFLVSRTIKKAKGEHKEKGAFFYISTVVVLSAIGAGSYFGYEEYQQLNTEFQNKARKEAKVAFIKTKEWCLEKSSRIYNASGYIEKTLYVPKFYESCLKISKSSFKFCSELEPMLIYSSNGKYFSSACRSAQVGEPGCKTLYKVAAEYCAV